MTQAPSSIRVGVIGAGAWGKNLVRNFRDLNALAAVADPLEVNRKWVAGECPGASVYSDHAALIASGLDAVAIATPAATHAAVASEAMRAGLDVFVEKPITLDPAEAAELCELAKQGQRVLMVGHLLLYQPAIAFIKDYVKAGKLGSVFSLHQHRSKLGRARSVENVLWSFGVHDVAVLLYLADQPVDEIHVFGHCGLQPGIEDDVYLHLRFKDGLAANLHNSWLWPRIQRELIVVGSEGMLVYDEANQQVSLIRKTIDADLASVDEGTEILFEGNGQPLRLELEHFLACCESRQQPKSDGQNGLAVTQILHEAEKLLRSR